MHHTLHAQRLLGHHAQVARALVGTQGQGLQRFDKTGQHRQGRADLMGHVRHEVAPHGLGLLQRRDIARQQQGAPVAIGVQMHRDAHRPRWRAEAPLQHHIVAEILGGIVGRELGIAHQVADRLHHIALGVKAELAGGHLVAPLDAALRIQQHHPIGRGLQRGQDLLQPVLAVADLGLLPAQKAPRTVCRLTPDTAHGRDFGQVTRAQPAQHTRATQQIPDKPGPRRQGGAQGCAPGTTLPPSQPATRYLPEQEIRNTPQHAVSNAFSEKQGRILCAPSTTSGPRPQHLFTLSLEIMTRLSASQACNCTWGWAVSR